MLGVLHGQELGQRVQRRQPRVARGDAVATPILQLRQEARDPIRAQVTDLQGLDRLLGVLRHEAQEQNNGIAVAAHRMGTHAALRGQVVLEEAHQGAAQVVGVRRLHHALATSSPYEASKRSLAACASSGIHRK